MNNFTLLLLILILSLFQMLLNYWLQYFVAFITHAYID